MEFLNEYCLLALAYLMINFTKVTNHIHPKTRELHMREEDAVWIEYVTIALISFMTLFNFFAMFKLSSKKIILDCKKKNQQKKSL